jgi:hypothetical protein
MMSARRADRSIDGFARARSPGLPRVIGFVQRWGFPVSALGSFGAGILSARQLGSFGAGDRLRDRDNDRARLATQPPHPNPPPRRGEGTRVGFVWCGGVAGSGVGFVWRGDLTAPQLGSFGAGGSRLPSLGSFGLPSSRLVGWVRLVRRPAIGFGRDEPKRVSDQVMPNCQRAAGNYRVLN